MLALYIGLMIYAMVFVFILTRQYANYHNKRGTVKKLIMYFAMLLWPMTALVVGLSIMMDLVNLYE